ncbi:hypothetical protein NDU88_006888, partial [Pleurodeles waltl]
VVLRTRAAFLPKVVTPFHLGQSITLVFLPSFPSIKEEERLFRLDLRRALSFYIERESSGWTISSSLATWGRGKERLSTKEHC